MRFAVAGSLTSGAAGVCGSEWAFRLNSCYDPDYTYAGHQPYGYDQLAAVYGFYIVNAVDVEVIFHDPTVDGLAVCALAQPSSASMTLPGKTNDIVAEMEFGAVGFLSNTGGQKLRMAKTFDLARVEGITKSQYDAQVGVYGAAVTTNPSLSPWLRIAASDTNGNSGSVVRVTVNLIYHTRFFRRNALAQS